MNSQRYVLIYSLLGLSLRYLSDDVEPVELSLDLRSFAGSIVSSGAGVALVAVGDEGDWSGARLKNAVGGLIVGCAIVDDDVRVSGWNVTATEVFIVKA